MAGICGTILTPSNGFGQQQQPLIGSILIEGHANVDETLIQSMIALKVGNPYNPRDGATTIKQLYRLGLFEDIRIYVGMAGNGLVVTVNVKEYPLLDRIEFNGNKKLKKPGKKPVKFKLKNELKNTSNTLIKNKKEPKYKKVFRLSLSGLKKFIFDIIFPVWRFFCCTNSLKVKLRYLKLHR